MINKGFLNNNNASGVTKSDGKGNVDSDIGAARMNMDGGTTGLRSSLSDSMSMANVGDRNEQDSDNYAASKPSNDLDSSVVGAVVTTDKGAPSYQSSPGTFFDREHVTEGSSSRTDGQVEPVSLGSSPSHDAPNHDTPEGHDTLLKIRAIEKQIFEGKLVLVGDDGKPLKPAVTVDATTSTGANPIEHLKVPQSQKELEEMLTAIGYYSKPPHDTSGPMASNGNATSSPNNVNDKVDTNAHGAVGIEKVGVYALKQPSTSFAGVTSTEPKKHTSNFCRLECNKKANGVDLSVPMKVVEEVNSRFENTLYGYFLGQ